MSSPSTPLPSEQALLEAARKGDAGAFERLTAPHVPRIRRLLRTILRSDADVEDALQEALFDAWRGIAKFRSNSMFFTWLHRVARNAALRMIQRASSRLPSAGSLHSQREEAEDEVPDLASPDQVLEAREWLQSFMARLDALPEQMRRPLELCAIDGENYKTVARACGIPVGTVRSRVHRARSELGLLAG